MATLAHVCDVHGAFSLYIKTSWQSLYKVFPTRGDGGVSPPTKNLLIHSVATKFLFPPTKSQFNLIKKKSFLAVVIAPVPFLFKFHTLLKQIMLIFIFNFN